MGLRVAVLELSARYGPPVYDEVEELLARDTFDLAILPEMSLTGYVSPQIDFDLSRFAEPINGPTVAKLGQLAKQHQAYLVGPLVLEEERRLYNASILLGPDGQVHAVYRKRHPWIPERWASKGPYPAPTVDILGVKTTFAICYDAHFLGEELAGADLLVFPSCWVDEEDTRPALLRSLAVKFRVAIANANWGPGIVEVQGQGGSCILDREGKLLASSTDRRGNATINPCTPGAERRSSDY